MNLHEMIHRCQQIIIDALKDASPECIILFARDRIDETNLIEVPHLIDTLLDEEKGAQVHKALNFLKGALSELCEEHYQWALNVGDMYRKNYGVSTVDARSLALEGLYKAAVRFQPRGSFKSYAMSWIRQVIQRSVDNRMQLSLDSPIKEGGVGTSTRIEQISDSDTLWGKSHFFAKDPFVLEELRLKYCDHMTMDQMKRLLADTDLADAVGC